MKWIGQHIYDLVSRFRSDVYLENVSTGTIASGAHLGLDSNNKIVKAVDGGGDITGVALTAGTGVDLTSVSGATGGAYAATIGVDVSDFMSSGTVTRVLTASGEDTMQAEPYFTFRNTGNNSTLALLSNEDTGDLFNIVTTTHGATTLSTVDDNATAAHFKIAADGDILLEPATGDLTMYNAVNDGNPTISLGSSATNRFEIKTGYNSGAQTLDEVYFNSYTTSGTTNDGRYIFQVDEVEIGRFLDGGIAWNGSGSFKAGLRDSNPTTSSATEGGKLQLQADDGAAMGDDHRLGVIEFLGAEDASATRSIGARIQAVCRDAWDSSNNDADLEFYTTDGTTESKVLTLDADKLATFTGAVTVTGALSGTLATASQTNITELGTIDVGVWNGTAIAHAYIGADAIDGDNIADDSVNSEHYVDGSIDTAHIADDQVTFAKASGVSPNVFGNVIKLIPSDFGVNDDGGNTKFGVGYIEVAGTGYGMRSPNSNAELFAFVSIPEGMKATHVNIHAKSTYSTEVFEVQIDDTTVSSKGTGNCNTNLDITDVNATATNFLAIMVSITATTDKVYGGTVTIAAI